ncbi:MAG: Na(+)/H(+) antiporter subunit B [Proteobacteria bacterium]|nr:Na(+)/H(+) antiporter subunit B [Pseudomonadota bacterium]
MLKRLFMLIALVLIAILFFDVASNFTERSELSGISQYYVEQGAEELGAANLVTSVVVTYRGLDTLGEVTVLFISAAGASLLLRRRRNTNKKLVVEESSEIVQTTLSIMFPIIMLFGVYIFINGHLTPGGGFQGGAVVASALLFFMLARPNDSISHKLLMKIESLSGFTYVVLGVLGVILAGGFLDNRVLGLGEFGSLFSAGLIPLIYILVGLKVGSELGSLLQKFRE